MKPKILASSIICLGLMGAATLSTFVEPKIEEAVADQTIHSDNFVFINDFLYSGLGLQIEFTFDAPKQQKTNSFSFLTADWHRLTEGLTMTFKSNGNVTANYGNVFKIDDHYYYQVMCSELESALNVAEGTTGHETLGMMYISASNVRINVQSVTIINSKFNAYPKVELRDENRTGIRYKAHFPSINSTSTYGMLITPNYYVSKYVDDYIGHLNEDHHSYIELNCNPVEITTPQDDLYKIFGRGYTIQGSITNILEENYQLPFCMIPFEKTISGDYIYGNFSKMTKCSLYDLCNEYVDSGKYDSLSSHTRQYVDSVINKCEVHTDIKTSTDNVTAYFAYNTEQVLKTAPLPETYDSTISIEGARNEVETAQLILNVKNNLNNKYYVNIEPFIHEDGAYKIPANAVEISRQLYQNVETNWTDLAYFNTAQYHGLREDPELGWWPDALLPFDLAIDSWENYLDTANGENNGLFFRFRIPEDAVPGIYTSNVVIRIVGEDTLVVPVRLSVYNINLPHESHSKYTMFVNNTEIEYVYGKAASYSDGRHYGTAYEMLADRGIGGGLPALIWQMNDLPQYIEEAKKNAMDDRIAAYYLPNCYQTVTCEFKLKYTKKSFFGTQSTAYEYVEFNNMPVFSAKDSFYEGDTSIILPGYETLLTELVKASTDECDLLKKVVVYFGLADEPYKNSDAQLQNVVCENTLRKSIKEVLKNTSLFVGKPGVKESLTNIPYICTCQPRGILKGLVKDGSQYYIEEISSISNKSNNCADCYLSSPSDIEQFHLTGYCPAYDCFDYFNNGSNEYGYQDLMNYLQDPDYNIWWYGCCMPVPPYPVNWVNSPIVRMRVNKWYQYRLGIQGELYYMCNRGSQITNNDSGGIDIIPHNEDDILAGACTYNDIYGDGQYIYPVHDMYKNIDSDVYWLSSLRLENLGQANDDYNYLYYANELVQQLPEADRYEATSRINAIINSLTTGPIYNTTNHALVMQKRNEIANYISALERMVS